MPTNANQTNESRKHLRPSKYLTYMSMAEVAAQRSHDAETKVGSVLVKESSGSIIATGTNGFVRNAPDSALPNTRPEKYAVIIHSEQNLILNCAHHGVGMEGTFVVCTLTPCCACTRSLWQVGVTRVIAKEKYRDFGSVLEMPDIKVTESITEEGFVELHYEAVSKP